MADENQDGLIKWGRPDKKHFTKCGRSLEIAFEVRVWIKT